MTDRPRVGASSCLLGDEVRFNGGHKRYRFLTDELGPHVDWVPYCPEVSIGLGTPREPIRLTADGRLVNRDGTADHTDGDGGAAAARARPQMARRWTGTCSRPSRRAAGSGPSRGTARTGWPPTTPGAGCTRPGC